MSLPIVAEDSTVTRSFNTTRFSSGAPYTLAGTPSLHARVDGGATEITTGFTLTADFDSKTGENQWALDLSASASYTAGSIVEIFIAAGTVDSVSAVGIKVYEFQIGTSGSADAAITRTLLALPAVAPDGAGGLPISDAGGLDLDGLNTNVSSILTDTAEIGAAGAGLTDLGGMSTTMKGQVNAEADTALVDYDALVPGDLPSNFSALAITAGGIVSAQLADGVTHGGTTALLRLGSSSSTPAFYVTNSGGDAVKFESTGGSGNGMSIITSAGHGLSIVTTNASGNSVRLIASSGVSALSLLGGSSGVIQIRGLNATPGIEILPLTGSLARGVYIHNATTGIEVNGSSNDILSDITGSLSGSAGSVTGAINTAAGTITTLDALDTAQDTQHGTTQTAITALNDISAADVWASATRTLTALGFTFAGSDFDAGSLNGLGDWSTLVASDILTALNTNTKPADGDPATWTWLEMSWMVGRRFYGKVKHDAVNQVIEVYDWDVSQTQITTQSATETAGVETQGESATP